MPVVQPVKMVLNSYLRQSFNHASGAVENTEYEWAMYCSAIVEAAVVSCGHKVILQPAGGHQRWGELSGWRWRLCVSRDATDWYQITRRSMDRQVAEAKTGSEAMEEDYQSGSVFLPYFYVVKKVGNFLFVIYPYKYEQLYVLL